MDFDKYKNTLEYPGCSIQICPRASCGIRFEKTDNFCKGCGFAVGEYLVDQKAKVHAGRLAWGNKEAEINEQFEKDALGEIGLTGHPKAHKALRYAWEHGHASGREEVFNILLGLVDLLK
jgi:hypothetical protein